jgi:hypothetical protein
MTRDGIFWEDAIDSCAVVPAGSVSSNAQIGCVPFGAAIETSMREPGRSTCPSK